MLPLNSRSSASSTRSERSSTETRARMPQAMRAAFEPTTPPPMMATRAPGTPGTPESRMPAPPASRLQAAGADLHRHAARDLAHRREQRQAAMRVGDGLVGDGGAAALHQAARLVRVGGEVQVGEEDLAGAEAPPLLRLRLLHLHHHLRLGEDGGGVGHHGGAGGDDRPCRGNRSRRRRRSRPAPRGRCGPVPAPRRAPARPGIRGPSPPWARRRASMVPLDPSSRRWVLDARAATPRRATTGKVQAATLAPRRAALRPPARAAGGRAAIASAPWPAAPLRWSAGRSPASRALPPASRSWRPGCAAAPRPGRRAARIASR